MKKYNILVTNDDGLNGQGLKPLISELSSCANVFTVVPRRQMSGASQSITLNKFRQVKSIGKNFYAIDGGTPTDCVKYALYSFLKDKCDIVVSGINDCANLGQDVMYSGTVGAAREAAFLRVCSIAASAYKRDIDYNEAAKTVKQIALHILKNKKKYKNICLNVNIPKNPKGIKIVPLGLRCYDENIDIKTDNKKNKYYKLSGRDIPFSKNEPSDIEACTQGYVSVTPLILNQTDEAVLKKINFKPC
jgi:5'-nucleotidase